MAPPTALAAVTMQDAVDTVAAVAGMVAAVTIAVVGAASAVVMPVKLHM